MCRVQYFPRYEEQDKCKKLLEVIPVFQREENDYIYIYRKRNVYIIIRLYSIRTESRYREIILSYTRASVWRQAIWGTWGISLYIYVLMVTSRRNCKKKPPSHLSNPFLRYDKLWVCSFRSVQCIDIHIPILRSSLDRTRGKARERILRVRVLVTYLYLPLAVQLCAVSI